MQSRHFALIAARRDVVGLGIGSPTRRAERPPGTSGFLRLVSGKLRLGAGRSCLVAAVAPPVIAALTHRTAAILRPWIGVEL